MGGGIILNGKLWAGAHGNAGEFTGMLSQKARKSRPTLTLLMTMLKADGIDIQSLADITNRYDPGWTAIGKWLELTRPTFVSLLSAISAVVDPEIIIVGGRAPRGLLDALVAGSEFFKDSRQKMERSFPPVVVSQLQQDVAAVGAAALPFKHYFFQ